MADTYDSIATTTLSLEQSTIVFSSIPATFTDLRVVFFMPINVTNGRTPFMRLNGDTGSNYHLTRMEATRTSRSTSNAGSATSFTPFNWAPPSTTRSRVSGTFDILNYAGSDFKRVLFAGGAAELSRMGGLWANTAAVNSVTLLCSAGNSQFATGTTATLFGILRA